MGKVPVVVGLSGGVDSSVAALILKRAGFDVRGVYLKCYWTYEGCQSDQDRNSAARVASHLNIPFEVWDFEKEYRARVIEYFYEEYKKGRTPNPDVVCNREIKFGLFLRRTLTGFGSGQRLAQGVLPDVRPNAESGLPLNARFCPKPRPKLEEKLTSPLFLATGHYARIGIEAKSEKLKVKSESEEWIMPSFCQAELAADAAGVKFIDIREYVDLVARSGSSKEGRAGNSGNFSIFGGEDAQKDQSYFLYDIDPTCLEHILFPLGNLTKSQVRVMAREAGLPTADRPDSTGICFIGEVNVEKFLKERIKEHEGKVVDVQGRTIGRHKGVEFYTIGQRHGFQITNNKSQFTNKIQNSKHKTQSSEPLYVVDKDVKNNRLIVGVGEECKRDKFQITNFNPQTNLNSQILKKEEIFVRIRHLGELIPCQLSVVSRQRLEVTLAYPVFGVAAGQSAVFYRQITTHNLQLTTSMWRVVGGGVIE